MMRNLIVAVAGATSFFGATALDAQAATSATREIYVKPQPTDVLSSNLIGLNVQNSTKETVGEIEDLVVSNGILSGLVLSVGDFLGIGERHVLVTPAAMNVVYSENDKKWSATMDTTKDALKAAPEFTYEGSWSK